MKVYKYLLLIIIALLVIGAILFSSTLISIALIIVGQFVDASLQRPILFALCFCGATSLLLSMGMPLGALSGLLAGFFWGPWLGLVVSTLIIMCSAIVVMYYAQQLVLWLPHLWQKKIQLYQHRVWTLEVLVLIRLMPILPFFLVNILFGLIPQRKILLWCSTLLGSLPMLVALTFVGSQARTIYSLNELSLITLINNFYFLTSLAIVFGLLVFNKLKGHLIVKAQERNQ